MLGGDGKKKTRNGEMLKQIEEINGRKKFLFSLGDVKKNLLKSRLASLSISDGLSSCMI